MFRLLAFSFLALFVVQSYGLEDPSASKIAEYKNLVAEWAETAKRIARSLEEQPQVDADHVSAQLQDALKEGQRHKRDTAEDFLQNLNEGFKSIMNNVTSSPLYQEIQKMGVNLNAKGKELVGQLQEQVKNFQAKQ